jgi:predicted Fe-S protein YdhL (DUF1289 family)
MSGKIISPCIEVCCMDNETGLCKGCYRTSREISNWIDYTDEERIEILDKLKYRKRDFSQS